MANDDSSAARIDAARPFTLSISREDDVLLSCVLEADRVCDLWAELSQIVGTLPRSITSGKVLITDGTGRIVIRTGLRSLRGRR